MCDKTIQISVDIYDNFHTLFTFKYIIFPIQTIKRILNLIDTFGIYRSGYTNKKLQITLKLFSFIFNF